jgi:DUF4097 and DUF4098 domain-containing protein YvlB
MRLTMTVPVLALAFTGCDFVEASGGMARYRQDFHYNFPLDKGGKVSVETFNGGVEVSAWDQNTVDISGEKWGPTQSAADALRIDTDHAPNAVSVRAVRPVELGGNRGARFAIKVPRGAVLDRVATSNGRITVEEGVGPAVIRTSNGSVRVKNFHGGISVQTSNAAVDLADVEGEATVRTSNGHIRAEDIRGGLDASTRNGPINVRISRAGAAVRAESSNGPIDLAIPEVPSGGVRAHTSNGGITLRLPAQAAARVIADTSNSTIRSDFDLPMSEGRRQHHMEGNIGAGGPLVDLTTSNGGIRLVKD